MDHKLAVVIVPADSQDPIAASSLLLERFQKVPLDGAAPEFVQKFRHKRVGGWFDGLADGQAGKERWSTVLKMLFDGSFAAISKGGSADGERILREIDASNTKKVTALSTLAPCTVIVTPAGEWFEEPEADVASEAARAAWSTTRSDLFAKYGDCMAVCWDVSWYFLGEPKPVAVATAVTASSTAPWRTITRKEAWAARIADATRAFAARQTGLDPVAAHREPALAVATVAL